jgi:threonine synthase
MVLEKNIYKQQNSTLKMQLYSTNRESPNVGIEEAVFRGLPPDNGLYLPEKFPKLPANFFENIENLSFQDIAFEVSNALLGEDIHATDLREIIEKSINFTAPVIEIEENIHCLELFHGPSMAFKDFGARFMAALMSYFLQKSQKKIHILVATSGDTGGAVAQGFYRTPNIDVTILYPSGKVSDIQEKQLTTLGENVRAIEVNGTFDDCQAMVKSAFLDKDLTDKFTLASANSINIARLIPQSFYYFNAFAQLKHKELPVAFSVPSGNFGNLSAGIMAAKMGLPVQHFVAATNINNVVPEYLRTGIYKTISPSLSTISNAMDVGNPSNFARIKALFDDNLGEMRALISGNFYDDAQTRAAMRDVEARTKYVMCPHTAIAYLGLQDYLKIQKNKVSGVFLSTAHYAKFLPDVEATLDKKVAIPARLAALLDKQKVATQMSNKFEDFKDWLISEL